MNKTTDKRVDGINGLYKRSNGSYKFDRHVNGCRYTETFGKISLEKAIHICNRFNLELKDGIDPIKKVERQSYTIDQLSKDWLKTKEIRSHATQQRYRAIIAHLLEFLQKPETPVNCIDTKVANQFHLWRLDKTKEEATHYTEITTLRSLFEYAKEKLKIIDKNPFESIEVKKPKYGKHNPLSHEEYDALLLSCIKYDEKSKFFTNLKDIIELTVHTGLRLDEVYHLEWSDIQNGSIRIFDKWISEHKICPIAQSVLPDLKHLVKSKDLDRHLFNSDNINQFKNRLPIRSPKKLALLKVRDINFEEGFLNYKNTFFWEPKATWIDGVVLGSRLKVRESAAMLYGDEMAKKRQIKQSYADKDNSLYSLRWLQV
jgi:integrase